jgi:hypothetical protein
MERGNVTLLGIDKSFDFPYFFASNHQHSCQHHFLLCGLVFLDYSRRTMASRPMLEDPSVDRDKNDKMSFRKCFRRKDDSSRSLISRSNTSQPIVHKVCSTRESFESSWTDITASVSSGSTESTATATTGRQQEPLRLQECYLQSKESRDDTSSTKKSVDWDLSANSIIAPDHHKMVKKEELWWTSQTRADRKIRDYTRIEGKSGVQNYMNECHQAYKYLLEEVNSSRFQERGTSGLLVTDDHMDSLLTRSFMGGFRHSCRGMEFLASRKRVKLIVTEVVQFSREQKGANALAEFVQNFGLVDRHWARLVALADHKCAR